MAKKGNFKFSDKVHPVKGMIATGTGAVSVLLLTALCIISGQKGGKGGLELGVIGLIVLILGIVGLILSILALKQKEIYYSFPVVGALINGVLTVFCLGLYITGIFL